MEEVIKCCGTCRHWDGDKNGIKGICMLNGKGTKFGDMKDCIGWKTVIKVEG